jgi:hypothetical protein
MATCCLRSGPKELVDTHGDSIVRLAEALEQRGSLSGDEVAALWRETSLAA